MPNKRADETKPLIARLKKKHVCFESILYDTDSIERPIARSRLHRTELEHIFTIYNKKSARLPCAQCAECTDLEDRIRSGA